MTQQGSQGQPGAQSGGGNANAPASGGVGTQDLEARFQSLESKLDGFLGGFDARLNKAITKRIKPAANTPATDPAARDDDGESGQDGGDDQGQSASTSRPAKPAKDPEVARLRAELQRMQSAQAEQAAKAAAARRESALRSAIAATGFDLHDSEAVFRVLSPDVEPDEDAPERLRPRDVAQQGKPLESYVKERIAQMKWAHRPTQRATTGPAGDQKPASDEFTWDRTKTPSEDDIERWRAHEAAKRKT